MNQEQPLLLFEIDNYCVYQSTINGHHIAIEKTQCQSEPVLKSIFLKNKLFERITIPQLESYREDGTFFVSISFSSTCNLACKYCFRDIHNVDTLSLEEVKKYINYSVIENGNASKYVIDLSGTGEPLLHFDMLVLIGQYCIELSNLIRKEIIPSFVTNGILLTKEKVMKLQEIGYIFGISVDGSKKTHDITRIDNQGKRTFDRIMKNALSIKEKKYIGIAVTLTPMTSGLLKAFKKFNKDFSTISIKPVRSNEEDYRFNSTNIFEALKEYAQVIEYSTYKAINGDIKYISSLINGDDYWGKFFTRIVTNTRVFTRCDAGLSRWSLVPNKKIVACPASLGIDELILGDLASGVTKEDKEKIRRFHGQRDVCLNCEARFICGGECLVEAYHSTGNVIGNNDVMCTFKKHLYKYAIWSRYIINMRNPEIYDNIRKLCINRIGRSASAQKFRDFVDANLDMSFSELKEIWYNQPDVYARMKK